MIRITAHPKDAAFLLLKVPQDLNSVMGNFGPAQLAVDLRGYVMPRANLEQLVAWAKFQNVALLNEAQEAGEPTKPVQCGNVIELVVGNKTITEECCAAYQAGKIPKFCGACGQPAKPVHFDDGEPVIGVKCPGCSHVNHAAAFCVVCGSALPDRHLSVPKRRRRHNRNPQTLSASEVAAALTPHTPAAPVALAGETA